MAGGNSLEGREQKKGIAVNTLYTMGGLLFMNAVLQIVITPLLNRMMGAEQLGGLLYITGLVAIICPSIGQALNNSRLVVRRDFDVTNGDYDWLLLGFGLIGSIVALFMSGKSLESPLMAAGVFLMFMLTVFRYYGDVEYRLNLNYRRYFIYYLLIGIGYLAGFGIYCTGFCRCYRKYFSSVFQKKRIFYDGTRSRLFSYVIVSYYQYDNEYGSPCDQTDPR